MLNQKSFKSEARASTLDFKQEGVIRVLEARQVNHKFKANLHYTASPLANKCFRSCVCACTHTCACMFMRVCIGICPWIWRLSFLTCGPPCFFFGGKAFHWP